MEKETFLELNGISKIFPGVKALDRVNLDIKKGEVHAILGENGAGKSTLMNVITGACQPEEGDMKLEGKKIKFGGVEDSLKSGIALVHQESSLLSYLDVKSNLYLGHFPSKFGFINSKLIRKKAIELFEQLGIVGVSPDAIVNNLSMANRQLVEIAKAISTNPKLLLLDEPTASFTDKETSVLFDIIGRLKSENVSIVYISHRMEEIFEIADVITVFRDGAHIITNDASNFTIDSLITNMVGRSLNDQMTELMRNREKVVQEEVVLEVENISRNKEFRNISFQLHKGEVLGLGGLVGAGRTELLESIFGYRKLDSGKIKVKGIQVAINNPSVAIKNKIAFIAENRKEKGLSLIASIMDNINIVTMKNNKKWLLLSNKKQNLAAEECVKKLNIKTPSVSKIVGELSGGNQQKVIVSRWLLSKPDILLLDEPTHGIDVGAKVEIYKIIENLTKDGISVVIASSEMAELLKLSDRILVMHTGNVTGEIIKSEVTQEKILMYASDNNINN